MFPNLKAEMARQNINMRDLSKLTGIAYQTLYAKMTGKSDILLSHCMKIKNALGNDLTLDYLFVKEERK